MIPDDILIYLLVGCLALHTLVDLWNIYHERFGGAVYVDYQLDCKLCLNDVDTEDPIEYGTSSPNSRLAWKMMREHYMQVHPGQLWRVGRLPRGHSSEQHT